MAIGICNLSIVPLRASASHRSEMVSQILFGEAFEIVEQDSDWASVRTLQETYSGFVQQGQFVVLTEDESKIYYDKPLHLIGIDGGIAKSGDMQINLLHGTRIHTEVLDKLNFGTFTYHLEADTFVPVAERFDTDIEALVLHYLSTPYLWGGRTRYGIDCSGFSQLIYSHFNINLPRDAYQQAELGVTVDFLTEIKKGDLAFFDNEQGRITHVGIMLDEERIIHASAKVRIDRMDLEGIFNAELNKYSHRLRIVKRFL